MSSILSDYFTQQELGVTVRTLGRWRARGLGPASIKLGRVRVYRRAAVQEYLRRREAEDARRGRSRATA